MTTLLQINASINDDNGQSSRLASSAAASATSALRSIGYKVRSDRKPSQWTSRFCGSTIRRSELSIARGKLDTSRRVPSRDQSVASR